MKTELLYKRYDTEEMTIEELKVLIWRYFQLLEQPENLLRKWRSSTHVKTQTAL